MTPDIWAAVPVKEFAGAKQRLSPTLTSEQRQALAAAMLEDVLAALAKAPLAGIMVNTADPVASELARRYGARVVTTGAVVVGSEPLLEAGRQPDGGRVLTLYGNPPHRLRDRILDESCPLGFFGSGCPRLSRSRPCPSWCRGSIRRLT